MPYAQEFCATRTIASTEDVVADLQFEIRNWQLTHEMEKHFMERGRKHSSRHSTSPGCPTSMCLYRRSAKKNGPQFRRTEGRNSYQ